MKVRYRKTDAESLDAALRREQCIVDEDEDDAELRQFMLRPEAMTLVVALGFLTGFMIAAGLDTPERRRRRERRHRVMYTSPQARRPRESDEELVLRDFSRVLDDYDRVLRRRVSAA